MGQIAIFMARHNIDQKYISMPFLALYVSFILFLPGFFDVTFDDLSNGYASLTISGEVSFWGVICIGLTFVNMVWTYFIVSSTQNPSTQNLSTQNPSTQNPSTQNPSTQNPSTQNPSTQNPSTQNQNQP